MISTVTQSAINVTMGDIMVSGALATLMLFILIGLKEFIFTGRDGGEEAGGSLNIFILPLLVVVSFLIYVVIKDYVDFLFRW